MKFAKNLEFDQDAIEDLAHWVRKDRRKAEKILNLIQEIAKDPFHGTGKPEPLKYDLSGWPSVKIRAIWGHLKNNPIKSTLLKFQPHQEI